MLTVLTFQALGRLGKVGKVGKVSVPRLETVMERIRKRWWRRTLSKHVTCNGLQLPRDEVALRHVPGTTTAGHTSNPTFLHLLFLERGPPTPTSQRATFDALQCLYATSALTRRRQSVSSRRPPSITLPPDLNVAHPVVFWIKHGIVG